MPAYLPNWDTLSGWCARQKPCPRLSAQSGMRFPDGMPSGNRVPESRPRTGHAFRLKRPAETASRNRRSNWDAVSGEGYSGKCVPFPARIPGCAFRLKLQPESASHSGAEFRDTLSARGPFRKARPILSIDSGTHFPLEGSKGKRIPFRANSGTQLPLQTKGPGSRWSRGQRRSVCS